MELSKLEQKYIEDAIEIGEKFGDSEELKQLCHKAYDDYRKGLISSRVYDKVYSVCSQYANPR